MSSVLAPPVLQYRIYLKSGPEIFQARILFEGYPYQLVYAGEIPGDASTVTTALEDIFSLFNHRDGHEVPEDYHHRSLSVGDVVAFDTPEPELSKGIVAFVCAMDGWKGISEHRVAGVPF